MKKCLTALFISGSILICMPRKIDAITVDRDTGLVVTGALLAAGGVYNLTKESESWLGTIGRVTAGITLIGLGSALIVFNKNINQEADALIGAIHWKHRQQRWGRKA